MPGGKEWLLCIINMKPIICSYFTEEYAALAERMIKSVEKFGFETDVIKISKINNSWIDIIYWRPEFILQMLWKHRNRDIVWLDCDATMEEYPVLFDNFPDDFGIHVHDFKWRKNEHLGGTMYFSYKQRTINFLRKWIELNKTTERQTLSQWIIPMAIKESPGLKVGILPESYCNIFDHINCKNPVITHWQASRQFRNN